MGCCESGGRSAALLLGLFLVLVEAGFVCVRLDVRGTGSSEGVAVDEYTEAEQLDGVEVVDWMSCQDWCNGNVGSWGKSYGGFSCGGSASSPEANRP